MSERLHPIKGSGWLLVLGGVIGVVGLLEFLAKGVPMQTKSAFTRPSASVDMDYLKGHNAAASTAPEHAEKISQTSNVDASHHAGPQIDEGTAAGARASEAIHSSSGVNEGVEATVQRGVEHDVDTLTNDERELLNNIVYRSFISPHQQTEILASQIKAGKISAADFAQYYAERRGKIEGASPYVMNLIERDFNAIAKGGVVSLLWGKIEVCPPGA